MSSYDSNKSGFLHPQYQQPAPPYPATPAPTSQPQQPAFYPPAPQQQQPLYSTSPTSQPFYSSSPTSQPGGGGGISMIPPPQQRDRRSSSFSSFSSTGQRRPSYLQQQQQQQSIPIPIRQPNPSDYQRTPPSSYPPQPVAGGYAPPMMPMHARSASLASHHSWEDKYETQYGAIDEESEREREYERRYAREKRAQRELESRPTLGGSLMSMVGKVGRAFGGSDRR